MQCNYCFVRGKKKGLRCTTKPRNGNEYCGAHAHKKKGAEQNPNDNLIKEFVNNILKNVKNEPLYENRNDMCVQLPQQSFPSPNISFKRRICDQKPPMDYEPEIKQWIRESIFKNINVFEYLMENFNTYYQNNCTSISDFKRRSTKVKGDIFETFCCLYLQNKGYQTWLLKDLPEDLLIQLKMVRKDYGIDIIAKKENKYYAIQCKYKKRQTRSRFNFIGWKALSTYYSLCNRTGPWEKYIVMTTADNVKRLGKKHYKDKTIAFTSFRNTSNKVWKDIIGYFNEGHKLSSESGNRKLEHNNTEEDNKKDNKLSKEEMRNARLKFFEKIRT